MKKGSTAITIMRAKIIVGRTVRGPDDPRWWRGRSVRAHNQLEL
jgi:hypothetical protein